MVSEFKFLLREGSGQDWDKLDSLPLDLDTNDNPNAELNSSIIIPSSTMIRYETNLKDRRNPAEKTTYSIEEKEDNRSNNRGKTTEEKEEDIDTIRFIERSPSAVSMELKEFPFLKDQIIDKKVDWDNSNSAQKTNTRGWYNIYGKLVVRNCGNTYLGDNIASIVPWSFGSIKAYSIDAVPESVFQLKGTEITKISTDGLEYRGQHLIRRGFLTNVIKKWCYVAGLKYIVTKKNEDGTISLKDVSGVRYWSFITRNELDGMDFFITGLHTVSMLKDFRYLIRNKGNSIRQSDVDKGKLSEQLYTLIHATALSENKTTKQVIDDMKSRLYYDCVIKDTIEGSETYGQPMIVWSFPKISIKYLNKVIRELSDGKKYYNDIYIPLIKNTRLYPIKCSDTRVFPLDDETHKKRKDDYDTLTHLYNHDNRGEGN